MQTAPVVIQMNDYSGFEKGRLDWNQSAGPVTVKPRRSQGCILYNGNQIVIFYGSNSLEPYEAGAK